MGNSRNLEHAEHNEKVYRYLCKEPEFCDWIITTAFYSAIYYIRHWMFPLEVTLKNGNTHKFSDFESLFNSFKKDGEGRHGFQLNWVRDHYGAISKNYRRLYELSNEARYINYQFPSNKIISEVNGHLKVIRLFCRADK
jgi:hypothetical protein